MAESILSLATRLRTEEGPGVVGVDLCGDPTARPGGEISIFSPVFKQAASNGLGITVHFAEAEASGSFDELRTLLSWNPGRLGHVIWEDDAAKKEIAERELCLELCLSCNVQAGMVHGGFQNHHFKHWFEMKRPRISLALPNTLASTVLKYVTWLVKELMVSSEEKKRGSDYATLCGLSQKQDMRILNRRIAAMISFIQHFQRMFKLASAWRAAAAKPMNGVASAGDAWAVAITDRVYLLVSAPVSQNFPGDTILEWAFGKRMTPAERLRKNQRMLDKAIRELDQTRVKLEKQEKTLIQQIKTSAKNGQMGACKIQAKDLVRTRRYIEKFFAMRSQLQKISLRLQTYRTNEQMMQAMKGATMALGSMNKSMNLPQLQRIAMEFERENDIMEQRQEMMDDAVDDAMDVGVEEEGDEVVEQVLEEIGVDIGQAMGETPNELGNPAIAEGKIAQAVGGGSGGDPVDDDLQARLDSLKK
ncbi:hypothetical protein EsDP_00004952 [Epichloe bromicola]|uniref:Adenosine deaminase domain-containing protein n=1 Tax=Epichloe bromicola TaxID=79588 RepID=A0ABQ0CTN6_9HYPO